MRTMVSIRVLFIVAILTAALAGSAAAQSEPGEIGSPRLISPLARVKPPSGVPLTKLEDLLGLPCGTGSAAGTVAFAINPMHHTVAFACVQTGQFLLDVAVGGPGSVDSITPEITCGLGAADCAHAFDAGDLVTLAASNDPDTSAFAGWGGACSGNDPVCQVTMSQAQRVTASFLPTLTLSLLTFASSRTTTCQFNICITADRFTEALARVTVTDLDTGLVAGTCDADTTLVVPVSQFSFPSTNLTTCNVPVVQGHHLRLTAEDSTTLGGVEHFNGWGPGPCEGSINPVCTPAEAVTVHAEANVGFIR
ncbi:MAG TPA: hypothetical protein VJV75_09495 [Candidatus Polarisedimenticolia bacterium]|nr:hypothetical protein [Candidatus Polarisedimenticolia bacterium]